VFIAVSLLFVLICLIPGLPKLLGHPKMRHAAKRFSIPWRRYQLIGVAEVAAAAGGVVGLFWRPAGLLAASGMILLLVGALVFYRRTNGTLREAVPALVALVVTAAYLAVAFAA
jgi:DoxX-like protein